MTCTHPLHMYYKIVDGKEQHIFVEDNSLATFLDARTGEIYEQKRDVPCGQCVACRLNRSSDWALRCSLETMLWPERSCKFLTLTYDDDHLPFNDENQIFNYGEIVMDSIPTLVKSDPAAFIKRLRARLSYLYNWEDLRVYYCGEYGSSTNRPHYHMILFNLPPQIVYKPFPGVNVSNLEHALYNCDLFDDCWKKGFVVVGEVTYASCAYVARYIMKKQLGQGSAVYDSFCITPEFTCMSRRPGIGKYYYDRDKDEFYPFDRITFSDSSGKKIIAKPPRYFDKLLAADDPLWMDYIKEQRSLSAENSLRLRRERTTLSDKEYLLMVDGNIKARINNLLRPLD